jgi:hypothetical protein
MSSQPVESKWFLPLTKSDARKGAKSGTYGRIVPYELKPREGSKTFQKQRLVMKTDEDKLVSVFELKQVMEKFQIYLQF